MRHLQDVVRPFLHRNHQRRIPSSTTPVVTTSPIHSCTSLPSFHSLLKTHRGVLAFFTTNKCRLSHKTQPLFKEFAESKNLDSSRSVAFVHVDLDFSRDAAAVGVEFGVRATPTFLFFVGGLKVSFRKRHSAW